MNSPSAEILQLDAVAQAATLAAGTLTSEQLLGLTLETIEARNPALNCFLYIDRVTAMAAARASDQRRAQEQLLSPVDGLIVAVKDNIDVAGQPTTAGLGKVLHRAEQDAPVIASLRAAGAIILGKLNMDEAAVGTDTNNPHHGRCHNPRYPGLVPGGSSGGSGAAVAAGLCSMALGSDTMGSVRVPAACCGVVGLKPSAQLVSNAGSVPCARRMDSIGPLARSLRDLELWLPILSQRQSDDFSLSCPQPTAEPATVSLQALTLATVADLNESIALSPAINALYQTVTAQLANACTRLQASTIGQVDFGKNRRAGLIAVEGDLAVELQALRQDAPHALSAGLTKMLNWFDKQPGTTLAQAHHQIDTTGAWLRSLLGSADALLLPTIPSAIPACDDPVPAGIADLTAPANMAGLPALSFVVASDDQGYPLSLQLIGPHGSDARLVAIAKAVTELLAK
ncbi:amidase [Halioxenophilus sp. WMMB6]|uniref:amidase n=1 Tax=Halioxenophilus sp. WMMB6 TaxID=3073815 RepID=UPI00295EC1C3|nr:amidase [Halioxenophilus sp. WMMB6]